MTVLHANVDVSFPEVLPDGRDERPVAASRRSGRRARPLRVPREGIGWTLPGPTGNGTGPT